MRQHPAPNHYDIEGIDMATKNVITPKICAVDGCDNGGTLRRGMCGKHYERWRRNGDPMKLYTPKSTGPCTIDGCANVGGLRRGLCRKHYRKWLEYGDPLAPDHPAPVADRLNARLDKSGDCWIWTGHKKASGHAQINRNGKHEYAHRIAWELANGPIPEGMQICHKCDNPPCCNPDHLFLGTQRDNMADKVSKGRQIRGSAAGKSNLTERDVVIIRERHAAGETFKLIARDYDVTDAAVRHIVNRKNWKHVE